MNGLSASGAAIPDSRIPQLTAVGPPAIRATPTMAPASAWVVETGRPIAEAKMTHAAAPEATARGKAGNASTSGPTIADVKALTSPTEITSDARPPANVHSVPQAIAVRYDARPLPARVATPFETSFAPLANARTAAPASVSTASVPDISSSSRHHRSS